MIKLICTAFVLIFLPGIIVAQSVLPKFTPLQMREDLDTLIKYLEQTHPNPYYRYPKADFYKAVDSVKHSLAKPLNKVDFYFAAESLLAKLEDGHTDFHIMNDYKSQDPSVLPYNFKLSTTPPFLICTGIQFDSPAQVPAGTQIISINGIPAEKVLNDVIDLNTGENRPFRAEFGASRLYFYLDAFYKANGKYTLVYKDGSTTKTAYIKGIRKKELDVLAGKSAPGATTIAAQTNFSLRILDKDKTAVIDFRSFDWDGYKPFIDSAFKAMKERGINNLVLNLVGDEGGDSDVGDDLFQYIYGKPFRQYDVSIEKNSRFLKERLKEHRINKPLDSADMALLAKPNGQLDTIKYPDIIPGDNPLRFDGMVYLLVNIQTYSSASDFAQCFKYYKRGIIIGEETGGLVKSYGDIVPAKLPNTQLEISISSILYNDIGTGENDWHGVVPDIKCNPEHALDKALELIRKDSK